MQALVNDAKAVSVAPERHRGASIRAHLLILIGAVSLPLLVLAVVLAFANAEAQRHVIEAVRRDVVNNLIHLLDREFVRIIAVAQALADAPEIDNLPSPAFRQLALALVKQQHLDAIGVFDRSGQLLDSSLAPQTLPRRADMTPIAAAFEGRVAISGFQQGVRIPTPRTALPG